MTNIMARIGLSMRITGALALVSAGTAIILLLGSLWIIDGIIDRADRRELRGHYDALQSDLRQETQRAAAMSALVAAMPPVQQAMAHGERAALLAFFGAGFASLRSTYGVEQFQFHTAPATSFLRVHDPGKFGDDLSSFRKTIVEANATDKPVLGLEGGVAGLGIRGVVPIDLAGKQLGTVEFGLSFGQPFFAQFKRLRHVDVEFHLLDAGTFKPFAGTLNGRSLFRVPEYSSAAEGRIIVRRTELAGLPVAALLGPIPDFSGKPIGVAELVMDNTDYVAAAGRAWQLAIGIAALGMICAGLMGWVLARGMTRPILAVTNVLG